MAQITLNQSKYFLLWEHKLVMVITTTVLSIGIAVCIWDHAGNLGRSFL